MHAKLAALTIATFLGILFPAYRHAEAEPARGPLRVHPPNPCYFADDSGKTVYLTGSHTWANLIDRGPSDPPPVFDFDEYLDLLSKHHHNFIRLWGRQVSWYHDYGERVLHAAPLAWARTGPGAALDGKPRFDLEKHDPAYFERLRARVKAAGRTRGLCLHHALRRHVRVPRRMEREPLPSEEQRERHRWLFFLGSATPSVSARPGKFARVFLGK